MLAALILVGVAYSTAALALPQGSLQRPGYGFFPMLVGVVIVTASVVSLVREGVEGGEAAESASEEPANEPAEGSASTRTRVIVITVLLLVYVLVADFLGHSATTALVTAVALRVLGGRPWRQTLLFGLATGILSYLLFAVVLDLPLPTSIFRLNL